MRALLERSRSARAAVAGLAAVAVLSLVHEAAANDAVDFFRISLWPEPAAAVPSAPEPEPAAVAPRVHRRARRIWAAASGRPLLVTLRRKPSRARLAGGRHPVHGRRSSDPRVVFPRLPILPQPSRPAIVSIYRDKTLREGDAVMMADGIHLFHATGAWPYPPRDFVRFTLTASLGWHLRQTLNDLDKNPPTRWSSMESTSG